MRKSLSTMIMGVLIVAACIHMWEIVSGHDPFERRAGWTEEKRNSLITDAVKLLQGLDKKLFRSFACIDQSALRIMALIVRRFAARMEPGLNGQPAPFQWLARAARLFRDQKL